MDHISDAISPTDFILGTKLQPNNSTTQVTMTLTLGQSHRSRSNVLKMCKKQKNWPYLECYFTYRLHTWYQGTTYKCPSNDPSAYDVDQRSKSKVKVKISRKWVKC